MEKWQQLLNKALLYIKNSNLPRESWTFGGGTVLMLQYGHRYSKGLLNYLSPKTNDTLENGKKIRGQEYKICQDFIKDLTKNQSNNLSL